jgi:hypothetical protein
VLQHTEVIGGDILLKRAHANSAASIPDPAPEWAGLITPASQSGTEKLATLSADLTVAQDYENYLNNREAINAMIAASHVRRRASRAHPRARSQARLQRHRMPRPFAAAANGQAVRQKHCASFR